MLIILAEVSPDDILIDESIFADTQKDLFIYEHLKYFISKLGYLPVVEVRLYGNLVFVTRGHLYALISKELGYKYIRIRILQDSSREDVENFLQKSSVIRLDWETVKQEASRIPLVDYVWYIVFFAHSLSQVERQIFEESIIKFLKEIKLPECVQESNEKIRYLNYPFFGECCEFQAYISIGDERWYGDWTRKLSNFNLKHVPIISVNGRKFQSNLNFQ
ncbi:MAG: hypothetical protein V7K69_00650 [Nostoc sp.]|uniref:hypothetical protein n=1 Tax=Nostoc sp. TaxID=1180 RepID=UPI002FFC01E5